MIKKPAVYSLEDKGAKLADYLEVNGGMEYVNGFSLNSYGGECFITLYQTRPSGKQGENISREVETLVMSEACVRKLYRSIKELYEKIDEDRAKRQPDYAGTITRLS